MTKFEEQNFPLDAEKIERAAETLQFYCHGAAKSRGWWNDMLSGEDLTSSGYPLHKPKKNVGELLMLVVTELAEGMEGARKGLMDDHITNRTMLEMELADAVIRLFDTSGGLGLDIPGAISEKLQYNANREDHKVTNRRAEGGKKF